MTGFLINCNTHTADQGTIQQTCQTRKTSITQTLPAKRSFSSTKTPSNIIKHCSNAVKPPSKTPPINPKKNPGLQCPINLIKIAPKKAIKTPISSTSKKPPPSDLRHQVSPPPSWCPNDPTRRAPSRWPSESRGTAPGRKTRSRGFVFLFSGAGKGSRIFFFFKLIYIYISI